MEEGPGRGSVSSLREAPSQTALRTPRAVQRTRFETYAAGKEGEDVRVGGHQSDSGSVGVPGPLRGLLCREDSGSRGCSAGDMSMDDPIKSSHRCPWRATRAVCNEVFLPGYTAPSSP